MCIADTNAVFADACEHMLAVAQLNMLSQCVSDRVCCWLSCIFVSMSATAILLLQMQEHGQECHSSLCQGELLQYTCLGGACPPAELSSDLVVHSCSGTLQGTLLSK